MSSKLPRMLQKPPGMVPTRVNPRSSYRWMAASFEATTALNCKPRKPLRAACASESFTSSRPSPKPRALDATA